MYQIIINPIIANINPPILNWLLVTPFNFSNMLFILDGNSVYKIPSIKKKRPKAIISSFIIFEIYFLGLIFPKNLKNSLSGDKITDVSPPINAVS
mgnify:CR=1 FL=1